MEYPGNLLYSKSHEWVLEQEDGTCVIGITHYAAEQMGGVVFVDLPDVDDDAEVGETIAEAESVKAVSEIISPVTGVVTAVNDELEENPALLNDQPYEAWIIKVNDVTDREDLLDADGYEEYVATL